MIKSRSAPIFKTKFDWGSLLADAGRVTPKTALFCLTAFVFVHSALLAEMRTWTSIQGSEIEAELVWQNSKDVNLRTADGRRIAAQKSSLSEADNAYLAKLRTEATTRPSAEEPRTKGWLTNYEDALAEAKKYDIPILYLSTNSHSCGYCIILERDVLSDSRFERFAKKSVVLYKADFAESYRDGKDAEERRSIFNRIYEERAVPRFIKVQGWPHIAIITPDEEVLHSEAERTVRDPRDFVRKYERIIETGQNAED